MCACHIRIDKLFHFDLLLQWLINLGIIPDAVFHVRAGHSVTGQRGETALCPANHATVIGAKVP